MSVSSPKRTLTCKFPSKQAIRRAVASSTAIETGQDVKTIEQKLRARFGNFRRVRLAE